MPSSTYIRLAGPLQSWAGLAVSGNFVRTEPRPTLSALRGLLAASLGAKRGQWPTWIDDVHFTLRGIRLQNMLMIFTPSVTGKMNLLSDGALRSCSK